MGRGPNGRRPREEWGNIDLSSSAHFDSSSSSELTGVDSTPQSGEDLDEVWKLDVVGLGTSGLRVPALMKSASRKVDVRLRGDGGAQSMHVRLCVMLLVSL